MKVLTAVWIWNVHVISNSYLVGQVELNRRIATKNAFDITNLFSTMKHGFAGYKKDLRKDFSMEND